jgi:DNA-binding MarR family transcriptional regulator
VADYQNRLLSFIKRAEQATQAAKEHAVRAENLTTAQYNVLLVLSHSPGITASELARRCFVTAQTMSSVLARLIDHGLVSRTAHPRHKGVLEATVTPAGQNILDLSDRRVETVEAALTGTLSPAEQDQLRDLLARCVTAAEQAIPAGEKHKATAADGQ